MMSVDRSTLPTLVLGSSSKSRKILLERLQIPFICDSPDIDESARPGESALELVRRLSSEKAAAVAERHPNALVIGSDQVAVNQDQILGKPGDAETAFHQLQMASGKTVQFYTGLCLHNARTGLQQVLVEPFMVKFRELDAAQIKGYIQKEKPFSCAGSFHSEGLGIALFDRLEGDDPAALMGLPLIRLVQMLENEGVDLLRE
jgi:septum formation protein